MTVVTAFDVFLSHSSLDKPAVEELARRLKKAGIEPFLDNPRVERCRTRRPRIPQT